MGWIFSKNTVYHYNGIAYDFYSIADLRQVQAACQWRIWPLPNEIKRKSSFNPVKTSPSIRSKLPFVDIIYVTTDRSLTERHANLRKAFRRQGISMKSMKWKMKWNFTTCNSNSSHSYVYQRLNLKDKPLSNSITIQND